MAYVQEPTTGTYREPYISFLSLKVPFNIIFQSTPSSPGRSLTFTNTEYFFCLTIQRQGVT